MKKLLLISSVVLHLNAISQCNSSANYPFNGNSNDISNNAYHGTVTTATLTSDRFGNPNSAYAFNGTSGYVELNNNNAIITNSNGFSITGWARMDGPGGGADVQNTLFVQRTDATGNGNPGFALHLENSAGNLSFGGRGDAGGAAQSVSIQAMPYGSYHHYAAVLDNTIMKLYVDGVEVASAPFTPDGNVASTVDYVLIGKNRYLGFDAGFFNGVIDEVQIYNCALSSNQIYNLYNGGISGGVFHDFNSDCITQQGESGIINRTGIINPGNIVVETGIDGQWFLDSLPAGSYTITYDVSGNWDATCSTTQNFTVVHPDSSTIVPPFGMISTQPCTSPNVTVSMPFIRRCFTNQKIYVQACNLYSATDIINNGYVDVTIDDLLDVTSSSLSFTDLGDNVYRFNLSDNSLFPGECEGFWIATTVSCNAVLNQTICNEANLFPAPSCVFDTIPADEPGDFTPCALPWDQSSISVDGWCDNDSIYFTITNTGSFGGGDMECYSPIRLFIDGEYVWLDSLMIVGGDTDTLVFAGDGRTWRLEVDQHPLHPGNSHPNAVVELCGNAANWTPDLVNTMSLDDADPIVDIYCGIVTGSYDPNDKTGFPLGITEDHFILPNGKLEYLIRFQNTGNDTAFTVVVRDTLDMDLDIFSVTSGVSSHNYSFTKHGPRVLEWTFNQIMLPDSTTDEPGSNGFVTFIVDQMSDLPDGTEINNEVGIYFDFNDPIITNTTSHIINRPIAEPMYTNVSNVSDTACFEYTLNDFTYTNSGNYYQVSGNTLYNLDLLISYPEIAGMASEDTVCLSQNITLNGLGGVSYVWSDGVVNNQPFAPDETQIYYVTGTDEFGCVSSDSVSITVNDSLVNADFLIAVNDNTTITLENISSPVNHDIYWTINGVFVSSDEIFTHTFTANGNYEICLNASNSCNSDSQCLNVTMNGLGIQVLSEQVLSVYPNPANSILYINFPSGFKNQNYSIYDVSGKLVLNGVINQNSINIESLTDGIYFLELNSDKNANRTKFIKN